METASESIVEGVYQKLKERAISYAFKPGERINEGEIAKELGISRTPLREALNRLSVEGFLRIIPGRGYFCRELDPNEVFNLYELRKALEVASVKLAVDRAEPNDIQSLFEFLDQTGPDPGQRAAVELVALDETFHERLMEMSGNLEMLRVLRNVNARIRFVRWIDMDRINRAGTQLEHHRILLALKERDSETCIAVLEKHIDRRLDQITSAIREGYAQIYMPTAKAGP